MSKTIKIQTLRKECLPTYSTSGSAGLDCFANLDRPIVVPAGETVLIPLGFKTELPKNWYADVRPRSGLAFRNGITLGNCVGLVDEDYFKEWGAIIHNHSSEPFEITPLMKICQIMFLERPKIKFKEVDYIDENQSDHTGFGSTTLKKVTK